MFFKQEWRYEIRRASTLVGGETKLFRPTFRDKVILFHVHDILYSLVFISD